MNSLVAGSWSSLCALISGGRTAGTGASCLLYYIIYYIALDDAIKRHPTMPETKVTFTAVHHVSNSRKFVLDMLQYFVTTSEFVFYHKNILLLFAFTVLLPDRFVNNSHFSILYFISTPGILPLINIIYK